MEVCFWLCAAAVVYPYVLYPAFVWMLARVFGRHGDPPALTDAELPTVSLLVVAYNEAKLIGGRIENALATDYPADKLRIYVASDGSTDATEAIVKSYADRGVECIAFRERRGKAKTLRAASEKLASDVVVLSDANSYFRPNAVRALASRFVDPFVGVACGRLILADNAGNKNCDGLYWRYETMLKKSESRLGALLGSNGAIYAIRRDLMANLPSNAIVDDFELPLLARLRTRCALLFEESAVADEETAPKMRVEFGRRVRIGAGAFQSLERLYPLLDPRRGWIAFTLLSHKVFRWFGPFFLIGSFAANCGLLDQPLYRATMALQLAFYLSAIVGLAAPAAWLPKVCRLPALFVTVNAALFVGFFKWLSGRASAVWEPTGRVNGAVSS